MDEDGLETCTAGCVEGMMSAHIIRASGVLLAGNGFGAGISHMSWPFSSSILSA